MNRSSRFLGLLLVLLTVGTMLAMAQAQFKLTINVSAGAFTQTPPLVIGINTGNTIGADVDTAVFHSFSDVLAPPVPPPPFDLDARLMTIPGRVATFPTGLGVGVFEDYRGYFSTSQVDSFKVVVQGDAVDANPTVITWPANVGTFETSAKIGIQGSPLASFTDMIAGTSLSVPGATANPLNLIIILQGPKVVTPGPTLDPAPPALAFGTVSAGSSKSVSLTVTNNGFANILHISGATLPTNVTIAPPAAGVNVNPGLSQVFNVTWTVPSGSTTPLTGAIVFASDAVGSPNTSVNVSGVAASFVNALQFVAPLDTQKIYDDSTNTTVGAYQQAISLVGFAGQPIKAVSFSVVTRGLIVIHPIAKSAKLGADWTMETKVFHLGSNPDGSSLDSIRVLLYGNGVGAVGGSLNADTQLVTFSFDAVDITAVDALTHIDINSVKGSDINAADAGVAANPASKWILVNNRLIWGDVNLDGQVDILDLLMIVDHIIGRHTLVPGSLNFLRADVAPWGSPAGPKPLGDGVVDVQDLVQLQTIILTGHYPNGLALAGRIAPTVVATQGDQLQKVDASQVKVTFYATGDRLTIAVKNSIAIKGIQVDLENAKAASSSFVSAMGMGGNYMVKPSVLRVLVYSASGQILEAGEHMLADMPMLISNPGSLKVKSIIVADENNQAIANPETEISLEQAPMIPAEFSLKQNFPNPFNPTTSIQFSVAQSSFVRLAVYNLLGQEVRVLFEGQAERGTHPAIVWDARDTHGHSVATGTYIYRMQAGSYVESRKMMLLK